MARTLNNEVDVLNIASLDNDIKDSFTRAMISEDVNTTSAAARKYLEGEYFIHNDRCLYKALEEIAAGTTITPDVNAELVTVSEELVRLFAQSPEGIFEVLSNVQNGDTATRSFVKGEQIIWKDKQLYKVTADVVSGGTWVVGTNIDLADNLTSQIQTLTNNDTAIKRMLAPIEDGTNYSSTYVKNTRFIRNNKLYRVTASSVNTSTPINTGTGGNATELPYTFTNAIMVTLPITVTKNTKLNGAATGIYTNNLVQVSMELTPASGNSIAAHNEAILSGLPAPAATIYTTLTTVKGQSIPCIITQGGDLKTYYSENAWSSGRLDATIMYFADRASL